MVSRTSAYDRWPCEEAKREKYIRVEHRTVDSPDKLTTPVDREQWYKLGRNHRIDNGWIARDFDDEGWFVEFNTLEELMAFQKKYGALVINRSYDNPDIINVEIYDDYRE